MEVDLKCKGCKTFKDFVSYKGRVSFALHIVCHDNRSLHYDKVPFMRSVGQKNILERDRNMRGIICLFFWGAIILELIMCLSHFWFTAFLLFAIFLMWEYVFIQLHIDDISGVRVFEISFNNETKHNLLNMGITNCGNRTYEIISKPTYKLIYQNLNSENMLINFLSRITILRLVIALIVLINRSRIRYNELRQYVLRTPTMYEEFGDDICQRQEVLEVIKLKKEKLEGDGLIVLGIEYIDKTLQYNIL